MPTSKQRIQFIDTIRGLAIVLMTLDHTRDFFHQNIQNIEPTDLTATTPALFFTRWITHFCAPTFVFLAGTSAYISLKNTGDDTANRSFLLKRGIWLVILNFTINNLFIFWDLTFSVFFSQVIAAIGFGFLILAALLRCKTITIFFIGAFIICFHGLLILVPQPQNEALKFITTWLFAAGYFQVSAHTAILLAYGIVPWAGILLVGYAFGQFITTNQPIQSKKLFKLSIILIGAFIALRFINIYGNPSPWAIQKSAIFTFMSFINVNKQPPSLQFVQLILGISMALMATVNLSKSYLNQILSIFGRVPLFYWLVHWNVLHIISLIFYTNKGYSIDKLQFTGFGFGRPADGTGLSLSLVYVVWVAVVVLLYPLCLWYGNFKEKNKQWAWLRYF